MIKDVQYSGINISFCDQGQGNPVLLLHGYLESLNIWDDFATELTRKFRVITIDLPGQGKSGVPGNIASMEIMAEAIKAVFDHLNIDKAAIIGHSMGGYAMLAFYEAYPERVKSLGFFHSVSVADTEEKRANRDREIGLIRQGKQNLIFNTNVPKSFANDNLEKFKDAIECAKRIAGQAPGENIIKVLEGMKVRKDRTYLVENSNLLILFVVGMKDNYIPPDKLLNLASKARNKQVIVLENSGHMGFIEEKELALDETENFLEKVFKN
jgi:pimeloyl-ACP methyl ester carboxylesterase